MVSHDGLGSELADQFDQRLKISTQLVLGGIGHHITPGVEANQLRVFRGSAFLQGDSSPAEVHNVGRAADDVGPPSAFQLDQGAAHRGGVGPAQPHIRVVDGLDDPRRAEASDEVLRAQLLEYLVGCLSDLGSRTASSWSARTGGRWGTSAGR